MIIRARFLPRRLNTPLARAKDMALSRKGLLIIAVVLLSIQPLLNLNNLFVQAAPNPSLSLTGSIWENEDGSSPDTVTQLAAGDGTIEAPWGSRINLRAQLKNSSDALSSTNLGLFYDKGDGFWSRVNQSDKKNDVNLPSRQVVHSTGSKGFFDTSIAIHSDGTVWISYYSGTTPNSALMVAKYVGSGGTGCNSAQWECTEVDNIGITGWYSSLAIDSEGNPWVSYYCSTDCEDLRVARYVGSGGTGCTSSAWTCTTVDDEGGNAIGRYTAIAFDGQGRAWVGYQDLTNARLNIATYVGSGGNCTDTAWECTDLTGGVEGYISLAFDENSDAWMSYRRNNDLGVARYVGSGGTGCLAGVTNWSCTIVDNGGTDNIAKGTAIAIDDNGVPWVSHANASQGDLEIAKYVGSGGNCTDTAWSCETVYSTGLVGEDSDIAFDDDNNAWVTFFDETNGYLRAARYVGSGGVGCDSSAWTCTVLDRDTSSLVGEDTSIIFDESGTAVISYVDSDNSDLVVMQVDEWRTGGGCDNNAYGSAWECVSLDDNKSFGRQSSMAIDPSGVPWVSFRNNNDLDLMIAKYVGQGGTGCEVSSWHCSTIDSTGNVGNNTSITFDKAGQPWVSYQDGASADLKVAYYVGSGGSCDNAAWECDAVDTTSSVDSQTTVVVDDSNSAWVAYHDNTAGALKVAQFVGTGGTGCNDTAWTCTTVENGNDNGEGVDIAIDDTGALWISFMSAGPTPEQELQVAKYVGSGGSNCVSGAWDCTTIWNYDAVNTTSIAIDPSGTPWIAYKVGGLNNKAYVAKYVGTGGTGCTGGVTSWDCDVIDDGGNDTGQGISLAFDAAGKAWVSYQDETADTLKVARHVGGAGTGCGSSVTAWSCNVVDNKAAGTTNINSNIVFDSDGKVWVSYFDDTNADLVIASLDRSGEILLAPAQRYDNGATISESHADMTSTTDTTNRDDADCIGGGTWNNGKYFSTGSAAGISLPDGSGTAQCTEVVFTLDLTQADVGADYRFMIATEDNWDTDKNSWRGLSGSVTNPELTVTDVSTIIGSGVNLRLPDCEDDADWGCETIDSTSSGNTGYHSSLGFDSEGNAIIAYFDDSTNDLLVARYVGTGGTGCDNSAWDCDMVDTNGGQFTSMAIGDDGSIYISSATQLTGDIRIAKYVGSGGTGCNDSAWDCETVDTGNGSSIYGYTSITLDLNNNPIIAYKYGDDTSGELRVARFVGGGNGSNCTSSDWSCETVWDSTNVSEFPEIETDNNGKIWIIFYRTTSTGLRLLEYVGSGGSGAASDAWDYTMIVSSGGGHGQHASIAFDHNNTAWISYYETTNTDLRVAHYVGSGGTGCDTAEWQCDTVDSTNNVGQHTSIAFDSEGNPWISYRYNTGNDIRYARYVGGSNGAGCSNGNWTCSTLESTGTVGYTSEIAFDPNGTPWIAYYDVTNYDLELAKLHVPDVIPSFDKHYRVQGRNAGNSIGRHVATLGASTTNNPGECDGNADYFGGCAFFHASGDYDTITAQANESPYITVSQRFDSNSELPTLFWQGTTTLAPSTSGDAGDLKVEVYRYGSTNAWESVTTDSTTSSCSSANCQLEGQPSGTAGDYFESKDGKYWVHFRIYQEPSTSSSITFKTDQIKAVTGEQRARHGGFMQDGFKRPLNWR